jgi:hypothetical protein
MKQSDFHSFNGSISERFSGGEFRFYVKSFFRSSGNGSSTL